MVPIVLDDGGEVGSHVGLGDDVIEFQPAPSFLERLYFGIYHALREGVELVLEYHGF